MCVSMVNFSVFEIRVRECIEVPRSLCGIADLHAFSNELHIANTLCLSSAIFFAYESQVGL